MKVSGIFFLLRGYQLIWQLLEKSKVNLEGIA